jgi:hypothetical protein
MKRQDVLKAWELCTTNPDDEFCPCDHCPMMDAGCDVYTEDDFIPIPHALVDEVHKLLDPAKSEFTHVRFLN